MASPSSHSTGGLLGARSDDGHRAPDTGQRGAVVTQFDSEAVERLRLAIARMVRRLRSAQTIDDWTPTQMSVLATVARQAPMRLSELAEVEGINPTMLSRVVAKLEEAGLIRRHNDPGDRRAVLVETTETGLRLHERNQAERAAALTATLDRMPKDQVAALLGALPALETLADRLGRGPRSPVDESTA